MQSIVGIRGFLSGNRDRDGNGCSFRNVNPEIHMWERPPEIRPNAELLCLGIVDVGQLQEQRRLQRQPGLPQTGRAPLSLAQLSPEPPQLLQQTEYELNGN
ncbi:hypothetical protein EK904_009309 [Melospiza melodia maxima]|nr:hypothetical protein EK904_009309 [Melospiza melodia maxima]